LDARAVGKFFPRELRGAAVLQRRLAGAVIEGDQFGEFRTIAGADVASDDGSGWLFAAVVVLDARTLAVLDIAHFAGPATAPYVPGFLSFREGPAVVAAFAQLRSAPDILVCDGHGRAHPRRFGLACHLGVALGLPTVGVGKSLLVGSHRELGPRRGATARLVDRGEVVGLALRTRARVRPVYVSVGHRVSLVAARRLILEWSPRYRVPTPVRCAHLEVSRMRDLARRGRPGARPGVADGAAEDRRRSRAAAGEARVELR
jgi:deoxyribonuclease V